MSGIFRAVATASSRRDEVFVVHKGALKLVQVLPDPREFGRGRRFGIHHRRWRAKSLEAPRENPRRGRGVAATRVDEEIAGFAGNPARGRLPRDDDASEHDAPQRPFAAAPQDAVAIANDNQSRRLMGVL
jgi:hypothetical protein